MKRFFPLAILCLAAASTASSAAEHDLLAHASVARIWVAQVSKTDAGEEKTDILMQQDGSDKPWQKLVTIPERVVSLASRSSQLAVLLSDGRWELVWAADGASTGPALPAGGRIVALIDDGDSLWAVGSVGGGFPVAAAAAATTAPTTGPSTLPQLDLPQKLVLFHEHLGRWRPVPPDFSPAGIGDISLAIVGDEQVVAFKSADGSVKFLRFSGERGLTPVNSPPLSPPQSIADFDLLSIGGKAVLWATSGKGAGSLYPIAPNAGPPVALTWPAGTAPQSAAIAAVGTTITLFGLHDGKLYEQRYDPNGKPVGLVAAVSAPTDVRDTDLEYWIDAVLMAALAFSVLATLYRRGEQLNHSAAAIAPPAPAPQLPRLAAGLIDMLPVLAAFGYMSFTIDPARDPMEQLESVPNVTIYCSAVGLYLLHTTLSEVITGRTIGKYILGLKTVTIDGTSPNVGQFLIRNLLRVIDLIFFPLTLVLISPLRQRSADVAAGTMVIRNSLKEPTGDTPPES
jgi:uncharacterized RDD family membrane protein YckC